MSIAHLLIQVAKIAAEKEAAVSKIQVEMHLAEREGQAKLASISNQMLLEKVCRFVLLCFTWK